MELFKNKKSPEVIVEAPSIESKLAQLALERERWSYIYENTTHPSAMIIRELHNVEAQIKSLITSEVEGEPRAEQ